MVDDRFDPDKLRINLEEYYSQRPREGSQVSADEEDSFDGYADEENREILDELAREDAGETGEVEEDAIDPEDLEIFNEHFVD